MTSNTIADPATDVHLALWVDAQEVDSEELDRLTCRLRDEIEELNVGSIELLKEGSTPVGTKSIEAVTLGGLVVLLLPVAIPKLIEFLQQWSLRGEGRKVRIKTQIGDRSLEVEYPLHAISEAEMKKLVRTLQGTLTEKPPP